MTELEAAKQGIVTQQMKKAAEVEGIPPARLRDLMAAGRAVIPKNLL